MILWLVTAVIVNDFETTGGVCEWQGIRAPIGWMVRRTLVFRQLA